MVPLSRGLQQLRLARRLRRDERGVAAIEFAFIAPVMIAMLLGIIDVSHAVSLNWRMANLNRTLADLSSTNRLITDIEMQNIFNASIAVMSTHKGVKPRMVVSSVVIGTDKKARVCWSEARNSALAPVPGLTVGSIVPLPNLEMARPDTSMIISTTTMTYDGYITPNFDMSSKSLYFRPRAGTIEPGKPEQVARVGKPTCAVP